MFMKIQSSEKISTEYLDINSCGCQHFHWLDMGSLRPNGRVDYHILYIAKGCCYVTESNEEIAAPEGSVIIYLPHERQEYKFYSDKESTSYFIHFSGTGCEELIEKFDLASKRIFYVGKSSQLINLYQNLIDDFQLKQPYFEYSCRGYLLTILAVISRKSKHKALNHTKKSIEEVCRQMHTNFASNMPMQYYANICNLSESRFSHIFKEQTGESPMSYILNIKIESAKELLENTDLSILQISEMVGMQSQNYFSRIFKKYTSYSPLKYREATNT